MKHWFLSSFAVLALSMSGQATEPTSSQALAALEDAQVDPKGTASAPASGCCNPCTTCCDNGCPGGSILAEVGFLILKPYWKNNPAMLAENDDDGFAVKDFGDAQQFVPRVAFGYLNNDGFGARIGWWGFATSQTDGLSDLDLASATPLGVFAADDLEDAQGMAASMALRLNVWDFEVLQLYPRENGAWLLSGGLRYAHMSQDYFAIDLDEVGDPITDFVNSGHNFDGVGPTVALQIRRGRNLYFAGTARGSLLFGQGKQNAVHALTTPAGIVVLEEGTSSYDMVLPVGELEFGLGVRQAVNGMVAFAEGGFNAQAWIEAGNSSRSAINTDFPSQSDPTLGLFGFYLKAGLTY